ncbi:otospiralin [Rattus norvegicus]|uniref:Otospiralin n=1 Tax=Rattus norvegicus TaxID=10116 RepID=A6JQV8_RAT|nr:otospiralin [Rattus norvegicus]
MCCSRVGSRGRKIPPNHSQSWSFATTRGNKGPLSSKGGPYTWKHFLTASRQTLEALDVSSEVLCGAGEQGLSPMHWISSRLLSSFENADPALPSAWNFRRNRSYY